MRRFEYTFSCPEPGGVRQRHVRPLEYSDMARVYREMDAHHRSRKRFLDPDIAYQEFYRLDKLYWVVDDVGLLIANQAGDVHVFFWDKRLRGREDLARTMMFVSMSVFNLTEVWTTIPVTERAVLAFAKRVGFKEEGTEDGVVKLTYKRGQTHGL